MLAAGGRANAIRSNEKTRVHRTPRRRGDVADCGTGAESGPPQNVYIAGQLTL